MYNEMPPGLGKFINDNADLELVRNGVMIHLLERGNRLHVMIEVNEDATQNNLRGIVSLACKWRDRVMKYQGAWDMGGANELLERLHEMNKAGVSYTNLAKMINASVEKHLREYLAYRAEVDALYPEYKSEFENDFYYYAFSTSFQNNCFALIHARDLLKAMSLKDNEIDLLLRDGLERIRAGELPFEIGYPISQRQVIEKLKAWRNGKKHKTIQVHRWD